MKKITIPHFHFSLRNIHPTLSSAWMIGVMTALVGTVAVALCAVSFFLGVFEADVVSVGVPSDVESISRDDLSRSVRIIDARIADFEQLKTLPPTLPDPSR